MKNLSLPSMSGRQKIMKEKRGIGIIRFLSKYASRDILDQMYKLFVRPHLDYG